MDESIDSAEQTNSRAVTAPENFSVSMRGVGSVEQATDMANMVGYVVRELSRQIDLTRLDGITVAYDYKQALHELDRGYESSHRLTPSDSVVVGVAMTPSVLRNGILKSHIVLNANLVEPLMNTEHEDFRLALHLLAHECAHVEVTYKFDSAFPSVLLRHQYGNVHDNIRWQVILACWDEYAATSISAPFGEQPTEGYEETFIRAVQETRAKANELIKAYRLHGDVGRILSEVYGVYGELLKFSAYHLGNLVGLGIPIEERPHSQSVLENHWFRPHFQEFREICKRIMDGYGTWPDKTAFEAIGDMIDKIVVEGGLIVSRLSDDQVHVDVPFTPQTLPS